MELHPNSKTSINLGFTIVELLVAIAVIGIIAAITIVSYNEIQGRGAVVVLKSDLDNASVQLTSDKIKNGIYAANANSLPKSTGTVYTYIQASTSYCLSATSVKSGNSTFHISSAKGVIGEGDCLQVWAKANLNVGTMVTGATTQTNNSILEKYCYNNLESNCTTNGGLYQWNEAMQYVIAEGAQGICPTGSHIPSDNDWKILEMQLGMTQVQVDATGWRGTNQGTQLKPGGTSGLNIPLAGYRATDGSFYSLSSYAFLWSSSESIPNAENRTLYLDNATVNRDSNVKGNGFSVRCLGN